MEPDKLEGTDRRKHLVGMAIDPDMAPDPDDPAVGADQNRCPKYPMEGLAVHRFFAPDAIGLQHLMLFIGSKGNGEFMLVAKRLLRPQWVGRDAEHGGVAFRKRSLQPAEVDGLLGAARRVRAWIEKQHQSFAREVGQRDGVAAVARKPEAWGFRPFR